MSIIEDLKSANIEALFDKADLYPYAFDTAPIKDSIILPEAVAFPKSTEDVVKIVSFAIKNDLKIISRGAGTCHTSGCKPCRNSIVIHFSKMNKILDINKNNLTAIVQPGVIVGQFQKEIDRFGLFFPPDPSNLKVSTIGGAVALSSGGARALKYGTTKDYVLNLEVVLADGTVIETGKNVTKNVTGYNLTSLFTGSEGSLGIITKATLKLIPKPEKSFLTMAYFNSLEVAGACVNEILSSFITPASIDLLDRNTIDTIEKFNPSGWLSYEAVLLIETDGNKEELDFNIQKLNEVLKKAGADKIVQSKNDEDNEKILNARRSAFACTAKLKPNVITEDVVVPRDRIIELIRIIQKLSQENGLTVCIMGHAGDGNIHPNFAIDFSDRNEVERFLKVKDRLFEEAVKLNGTLSGEHGIGSEKKKYLDFALNEGSYNLMKKIKQAFDPNNRLNPDVMF